MFGKKDIKSYIINIFQWNPRFALAYLTEDPLKIILS